MPVTELNHYFVRANNLETSRHFYCEVLGFEEMYRPNFPFPGYWLGVGGKIQVHMGPHGIPNSDLYYLGTSAESAIDNAGVIDHIAFLANEPQSFSERFEKIGLKVRKRYLPEVHLFQMFVKDPDGLTIELNFNGIQDYPAWVSDGENYADMPRMTVFEK